MVEQRRCAAILRRYTTSSAPLFRENPELSEYDRQYNGYKIMYLFSLCGPVPNDSWTVTGQHGLWQLHADMKNLDLLVAFLRCLCRICAEIEQLISSFVLLLDDWKYSMGASVVLLSLLSDTHRRHSSVMEGEREETESVCLSCPAEPLAVGLFTATLCQNQAEFDSASY